jgi:hypothetical protein
LPNTYSVQVQGAEATTAGTTVAVVEGKINVFVNKTMHVIGDVTGYYAPHISGRIGSNGAILKATPRIINSSRIGVGTYSVAIDRYVASCMVMSTGFDVGSFVVNVYPFNNSITGQVYSSATGSPVDAAWQFLVAC